MSDVASAPAAGPSRAATVEDESTALAAEAGVVVASSSSSAPAAANGSTSAANGDADDDDEQLDANGLPKNASETLYLHNLNEKVRIPGVYTPVPVSVR